MRDDFEFPLVRRALEADLPIFTTCRGTQLLNVALGGTLCMDVPSLGATEGMVQWRHVGILNGPAHPVRSRPGRSYSRANGGVTTAQVELRAPLLRGVLGEGARLSARATDGVPEAIEVPDRRFCLGVQWHP